MGVTITGEAGFKQFVKGTRKFSNELKNMTFENRLLKKICDEARDYLTISYTTTYSTQSRPLVSIDYTSTTTATLVASGEDVMFIEFGTGTMGQRSGYQGDLPSEGVPITGAWDYNYPSRYKRHAKSGTIIWKIGNKALWGTEWVNQNGWSRGIPSQHQIYDTCVYIERMMPTLLEAIMRTYYV